MKEVDLSNAKIRKLKMYGGRSGSKICVDYCGKSYMLKFSPPARGNPDLSYKNSSICEHIACSIFGLLGLEAQSTFLCTYNEKIAVACEDFEQDGYLLKEFAYLKNTIIDSSNSGYGTELSDILDTINTQDIVDKTVLTRFFWDMFICDTLLGNFDRHNGNWGFLANLSTGDVKIAPVFDCGSCLYPQMHEPLMENVLSDNKLIEERLYTFPTSAIKIDDVKINYYRFLMTTDDQNCIDSLLKISKKIDMGGINEIIENTPYVTNLHKTFLKTIIAERKTKIIDKAAGRF